MPSEWLIAQAKDAVHGEADFDMLERELTPFSCMQVSSQAANRTIYLQRPDLGRRYPAPWGGGWRRFLDR